MVIEEKKAGQHICPHLTEWRQKCEGSRCMAWRWEVLTKIEKEGDDGLEYLVTVRSDVHGFCGLAGRP